MKNKTRIAILLLRLALGGLFLYNGIDKLLSGFSAGGYLLNATYGPFEAIFQSMAGSSLVDLLVIWGEIGIGLTITFGVFLRLGVFCGVVILALFYFSAFPPEHGLISEHIIYILVFVLLGTTELRYLRLDHYLKTYI
jgi:thiosulfate dehydrogenase [quinone] large subunit